MVKKTHAAALRTALNRLGATQPPPISTPDEVAALSVEIARQHASLAPPLAEAARALHLALLGARTKRLQRAHR